MQIRQPSWYTRLLESHSSHFNPDLAAEDLDDLDRARAVAERLGIPLQPGYGLGKVQIEIFEKTVEHRLIEPTFITAYPTEVSPLARRIYSHPAASKSPGLLLHHKRSIRKLTV